MTTLAVVGLGYVGLPLAVEFGKKYRTIGFDLSAEKVEAYKRHVDPTGEVSASRAEGGGPPAAHDGCQQRSKTPTSSSSPCRRRSTKRTYPISRRWSARAHRSGKNLKQGAIVVYESTVYPGATEEVCIPDAREALRH